LWRLQEESHVCRVGFSGERLRPTFGRARRRAPLFYFQGIWASPVITILEVILMKRILVAALAMMLLLSTVAEGRLDSKKAMYVGGTVTSIKEATEGTSSTNDEKVFVFTYKDGKLEVPYDRINDLEYGQKAGRRLGLALAISPWLLFSKKRKHFLTIGFQDANDKQQAAVFEIGKDIVRTTLASMEARTGKKIDYQDDEARKSGLGN